MKTEKLNRTNIQRYKYVLVLLALLNCMVTPVYVSVLPVSSSLIVVANFTLLILAGLAICGHSKNNFLYYASGVVTIIAIWLEFSYPTVTWLKLTRQLCSLVLFSFLTYILISHLVSDKSFNASTILGAISGYLFIGFIGGVVFEMVHYFNPESFAGSGIGDSYSYYYYSFISISSVGYGDIVPITSQARSMAVLLSITGQLYLTVVVALFVGKYLAVHFEKD